MRNFILVFLCLLLLTFCRPERPHEHTPANKFSNTVLREVHIYQDERDTQKLLPFLSSADSASKEEAILAFASVQDSVAEPHLIKLLQDKKAQMRLAAAYSLGQLGRESTASALITEINLESEAGVKQVMLEALGKCANDKAIKFLADFNPKNTEETEGLAWGIYRAGLKGIFSDKSINKASKLLAQENPAHARLGAAHFFARTRDMNIDNFDSVLVNILKIEENIFVRMAIAGALGKIKNENVKKGLLNLLDGNEDYRVQANALRALSKQEITEFGENVWDKLGHENVNLSLTVANFLKEKATNIDLERIITEANKDVNWRTRAILLKKAVALSNDKTGISNKVLEFYTHSSNKYEKALLLEALGQHHENYGFIAKETFDGGEKVLSTYGLGALGEIRQSEDFPNELQAEFADFFKTAIETGDVALIGIAATIIRDKNLNFQEEYDDYSFILNALSGLSLPQDIETYIELQRTIDFLKGEKTNAETSAPFNHPIDWSVVEGIPKGQKMVIQTSRGDVKIELLIDEAPASAANFYALATDGFFDGKNFHRVVPNFVAQGGCPRGDGWGSSAYSIRSEFGPLNYAEGYIGMASAGKDTESCQWFITHSPTPHLDGRYSIFAKVVEGMDIVHKLEMGDEIKKVIKLNK